MTTVFGTSWLETARQLLVARLQELLTTMSTGYDPTITAVYDSHTVAGMALNSVSIGLDRSDRIDGSSAVGVTGIDAAHGIAFSIRVHTDYSGGLHNELTQARLLESIENKLRLRLNLNTSGTKISRFEIESVGPLVTRQEFAESATIGGALLVQIWVVVEHTQE